MPTSIITGGLTVDGVAQGATTGAMTLYVDAATGVDTNDGTVSKPLRQIQTALDRVPEIINHNVIINVGAGSYGQINSTSKIVNTGTLTVTGTMATFTPATGSASGTFDSVSDNVLTLAGAGWTINDLKGKFLVIGSNYYPILSNTATTVTISDRTRTGTPAFSFAVPTSIIDGDSGISPVVYFGCMPPFGNPSVAQFKNFIIRDTLAHKSSLAIIPKWRCGSFSRCSFLGRATNNTYSTEVWVAGTGYLYDCYFSNTDTTSSIAFIDTNAVTVANCAFDSIAITANNSDAHLYNCTLNGYLAAACPPVFLISRSLVELNDVMLTTVAGNGIELTQGCDSLWLTDTTKIIGCTGFGVNAATEFGSLSKKACYNSIYVASTVAMSTNTAGDFSIDGTTPIAIADLRLDADKTMVDLARLNRLAAD